MSTEDQPQPGHGAPEEFDARSRYEDRVAWGLASAIQLRWPSVAAVAVAIGLQLVVPPILAHRLGPRWLIPTLEAVLLIGIVIANPRRVDDEARALRALSLGLIALISLANVITLFDLIRLLLVNGGGNGRVLIYASLPIWLTNVIVFGLWYWELDRGGVAARLSDQHRRPDFLFPQMSTPGVDPGWTPTFLDYLYTSFTNATAFSPTDTMPLTPWAKLLMMAQSMASLLTVALVISRAVNVLQ